MLRIGSEEEMRSAFRPIDQDEVQLPSDMLFPLLVRDTLTWIEPSGHRAYIVYADPSKNSARGIVFKRNHATADSPPAMCDWCHSVRGKGNVGLLTASVSRSRRIGLSLCRDLNCIEKLKETPGVHDLRESVQTDEKKRRILDRISHFARRNLF